MSDERYSYQQKFVKLSENWRKRDCVLLWFVCSKKEKKAAGRATV